jgi:23S rRNA pseudouridine1911/1915/1917 synthase
VTPSHRQRQLVIDRGDTGRRLDLVVCRHLADLEQATRTRVQRWIAAGAVSINGTAPRRAATRVAAGDRIAVALPAGIGESRRAPSAEDLPLDILYEDDHLLAVHKPAGMVVHPTYRHREGTLLNGLLWRAREWPASARPSIVGRLDKQTSGIVIVARQTAIHAALQRALASAQTEKLYLALVYGRVTPPRGAIDLPLRRDPRDRRRVIATADQGAASLTRYVREGIAPAPPHGLSLLQCRLVTGRMHQIRVHLAARGWPVVGDTKYGAPRWRDLTDAALREKLAGLTRQALHAWRVVFVHPMTARTLAIDAPLPQDLKGVLDACGLAAGM